MEEHIHILLSVDTTFRIFDIPKLLKGASSYYVNEARLTKSHFEWQDGYAVYSVSPYTLPTLRNYIRRQQDHHKQHSIQNELENLKKYAGDCSLM